MEQLSYTFETLKRPFIWLIILAAILLLVLGAKRQEIDDFSYFFLVLCAIAFGFIMLRENNRSIRNLKYRSGKRLML